eukprot:1091137-Pelagomonas_calceolata.AAC.2
MSCRTTSIVSHSMRCLKATQDLKSSLNNVLWSSLGQRHAVSACNTGPQQRARDLLWVRDPQAGGNLRGPACVAGCREWRVCAPASATPDSHTAEQAGMRTSCGRSMHRHNTNTCAAEHVVFSLTLWVSDASYSQTHSEVSAGKLMLGGALACAVYASFK